VYSVTSPDLKITAYKTDPLTEEDFALLDGVMRQFEANVAEGKGLEPNDKVFLQPFVNGINDALTAKEYARAWSLLTEPRVWTLKGKMENGKL